MPAVFNQNEYSGKPGPNPTMLGLLKMIWYQLWHLGSSGEVGSATAANQATQIIAEQAILAKLPAVGTAGAASANVLTVQGIANGTAAAVSNQTLTDVGAGEYETVAASQTDQILGATGAVGDYLAGLLVVPATTGAGSVSIKDGNGSAISVFVAGTLPGLVPFFIPLGIKCVAATTPGWKITTGASVSVIATGNFT